jgi:hypothetical protein
LSAEGTVSLWCFLQIVPIMRELRDVAECDGTAPGRAALLLGFMLERGLVEPTDRRDPHEPVAALAVAAG